MKAPVHRRVAQDDLAMTSMIDVVFLLLVFFVWTSSFDRPELELAGRIAMPAKSLDAIDQQGVDAQSTPNQTDPLEQPREEIIVRILGDRDQLSYQVGAVEVASLAEVKARLRTIAGLRLGAIVIIDPDDEVMTADCVEVFDAATQIGFARVLFAVD